jgi:dihydroorotase
MTFDLILKNGRVIDPSQSLDRVTDVGFSCGKVAAVGDGLQDAGAEVRDVTGRIVTPGLIDLHTHVYDGGTSISIDPEPYARNSVVSTIVDTGSAGPGNFSGFRKHVIDRSDVRILAYLHVAFAGIHAFSKRVMVGEGSDLRLFSVPDAVEVARANPDVVIGIKVRIGRNASGASGIMPMDVALEVAGETDLPLMVHIDHPPPSYEAVVDRLRPGDILTHCFRPFPNTPMNKDGSVKPAVLAARERGVLFDIGHGMGSFSYHTGRAALSRGFKPDTISSDVHVLSVGGPAYDQITTLSKFLALGMSLDEVIAASTVNPAKALRRLELGSLRPGSVGDASILSLDEGAFPLVDGAGEVFNAERRIFARGLVLAGRWWHSTNTGTAS